MKKQLIILSVILLCLSCLQIQDAQIEEPPINCTNTINFPDDAVGSGILLSIEKSASDVHLVLHTAAIYNCANYYLVVDTMRNQKNELTFFIIKVGDPIGCLTLSKPASFYYSLKNLAEGDYLIILKDNKYEDKYRLKISKNREVKIYCLHSSFTVVWP